MVNVKLTGEIHHKEKYGFHRKTNDTSLDNYCLWWLLSKGSFREIIKSFLTPRN